MVSEVFAPAPQAVILCGGYGTRLASLLGDLPKPMIDVCGKPFLEHQVLWLAKHGVQKFLLLASYRAEKITAHFQSARLKALGLTIDFCLEQTPLGTGGALLQAKGQIEDRFFLINGDSFLETPSTDFTRAWQLLSQPLGLMSAFCNPNPQSSAFEDNNLLLESSEQSSTPTKILRYAKRSGDPKMLHVDAGMSLYSKGIFDFLPLSASTETAFSFEEQWLPHLIQSGRLYGLPVNTPPYDIGTPTRLETFKHWILTQSPR